MPATYILATDDQELLRAWWVLVPPGRQILSLEESSAPGVLDSSIPMVLVLDASVAERLPATLRQAPAVIIGEQGSLAMERARALGNGRVVLGYDEARTRLGGLLPILEELAERSAALQLSDHRMLSTPAAAGSAAPFSAPVVTRFGSSTSNDASAAWDAVEAVVERLGSRSRVLEEFRRMVRAVLNTSSMLFFLRDGTGFRADRGEATCAGDDPLCAYWSQYPAILDGADWPAPITPLAEVSIRQRFRQWSSRLLVPVHENGRLYGFIALGVRDDGGPFTSGDRNKAIGLARLLRQCLEQSSRFGKISEQNERWRLAEHYLPNLLVLSTDEPIPKHVPAAIRSLIADVRGSRETRRMSPTVDQPFRAQAGLSETLGVWVYWEDAAAEVRESTQRQRSARLALLHDIALTLNHELGNALVSLAALRFNPNADTGSASLSTAVKRDIASLESINRHLASIPTFSEVVPEETDIRALLRDLARRTGVNFESSGAPVVLTVVPKLLDFALESILESIAENRPELGKRDLSVRLRTIGDNDRMTAALSIRGPKLALEGIWPPTEPGDAPSHGRISVFVAKEIIRLHGGDIRASQNTLGAEINVSLGNW